MNVEHCSKVIQRDARKRAQIDVEKARRNEKMKETTRTREISVKQARSGQLIASAAKRLHAEMKILDGGNTKKKKQQTPCHKAIGKPSSETSFKKEARAEALRKRWLEPPPPPGVEEAQQ